MKNYFKIGEHVMMKCLLLGKIGVSKARFEGPGEIVGILDPKSYLVKLGGKVYRRHEVYLKRCTNI